MPVFNAVPFLHQAVESVLAQTFSDWELLAIDDASTDDSLRVLHAFADPRVRVERNAQNVGVTRTLNRGLALARGELVARLDGDDFAYPTRLERQVAHLDAHSEVALLGSWADCVDSSGRPFMLQQTPSSNEEIQACMMETNCFFHPSTIFRRQAALDLGGYDETLRQAQDYDLWLRFCEHYRVGNLAEPLIAYRVHAGQISRRKLGAQRVFAERARDASILRRKARGQLPPGFSWPRLSTWDRLRGVRGTVGDDYLYWARMYRRMGAQAQATRMAIGGLWHGPLAPEAYRALVTSLVRGALTYWK